MWKVFIDPTLKSDVPTTIIKRLGSLIPDPPVKVKKFHNYPTTIDYEGSRYFVVYQFHEENTRFIKQVRIVKR
jgi:hypothetical protein